MANNNSQVDIIGNAKFQNYTPENVVPSMDTIIYCIDQTLSDTNIEKGILINNIKNLFGVHPEQLKKKQIKSIRK